MNKILYSVLSNEKAMKSLEDAGFSKEKIRELVGAHAKRVEEAPANFEYFPREGRQELYSWPAPTVSVEKPRIKRTRPFSRLLGRIANSAPLVDFAPMLAIANRPTTTDLTRAEKLFLRKQRRSSKSRQLKSIYGVIIKKTIVTSDKSSGAPRAAELDDATLQLLRRKMRVFVPNKSDTELQDQLNSLIQQAQADAKNKVRRSRQNLFKSVAPTKDISVVAVGNSIKH